MKTVTGLKIEIKKNEIRVQSDKVFNDPCYDVPYGVKVQSMTRNEKPPFINWLNKIFHYDEIKY